MPTAPTRHTRRRVGIAGLIGAGALAVATLWVDHNGGFGVAGGGEALVAIGRVTGLEASYAALVTVLLLARLPWVDRLLGMPELASWHRWLGEACVWLLVAHTVFTTWGYATQAHASTLHELRYLVLDLPDLLAATLGLVLFLLVAVASLRAVKRRLRYETWHFTHLYVYLALALSFAHEFATGADFATHLASRVLWASLHLAVLAALLTFRIAVPVIRSLRHDLRVTAVEPAAARSVNVLIGGRRLTAYAAQPGQFYLWRFLAPGLWWQAHPFSVSAAVTHDQLRITVRDSGDFTSAINRVPVGCRVIVEGPFGTFVPIQDGRPVLMIAAGAGIAPIRAMLGNGHALDPAEVTLIYRASRDEDFALRAELDGLASDQGLRVHYVAGARDSCLDVADPAVLAGLTERPLADHVAYVCGPPAFTDSLRRTLVTAGLASRDVHYERFRL